MALSSACATLSEKEMQILASLFLSEGLIPLPARYFKSIYRIILFAGSQDPAGKSICTYQAMHMKLAFNRAVVKEILIALFIFLFAYTGFDKLFNRVSFEGVLAQSPLIGSYAKALSWGIPAMELVTVTLLIFPRTKRWGLYSFFSMMLGFSLYITYMLATTSHLPCHCGGVISKMNWSQHLAFNVLFTILGWWMIYDSRSGNDPRYNTSRVRASV